MDNQTARLPRMVARLLELSHTWTTVPKVSLCPTLDIPKERKTVRPKSVCSQKRQTQTPCQLHRGVVSSRQLGGCIGAEMPRWFSLPAQDSIKPRRDQQSCSNSNRVLSSGALSSFHVIFAALARRPLLYPAAAVVLSRSADAPTSSSTASRGGWLCESP